MYTNGPSGSQMARDRGALKVRVLGDGVTSEESALVMGSRGVPDSSPLQPAAVLTRRQALPSSMQTLAEGPGSESPCCTRWSFASGKQGS